MSEFSNRYHRWPSLLSGDWFGHTCYNMGMKNMTILVLAVLVCAGCKDKGNDTGEDDTIPNAPRLTEDLMFDGLDGLTLGVTTEADLNASLSSPTREADTSLGGEMSVARNDHPAVVLRYDSRPRILRQGINNGVSPEVLERQLGSMTNLLPADSPLEKLELWFIALGESATPVLAGIEVTVATGELCSWVDEHVGSDEEATRCAGTNRRFGRDDAERASYCVGSPDGERRVFLDCTARTRGDVTEETAEYWLALDP